MLPLNPHINKRTGHVGLRAVSYQGFPILYEREGAALLIQLQVSQQLQGGKHQLALLAQKCTVLRNLYIQSVYSGSLKNAFLYPFFLFSCIALVLFVESLSQQTINNGLKVPLQRVELTFFCKR